MECNRCNVTHFIPKVSLEPTFMLAVETVVVLQKAMQSTPRDFTKNANELSLVTVLAPGNAWKNFVVNQI